MGYLDKYKISVPAGVSGQWRVEKFTVSGEDAGLERLRSMFSGGRGVPEGDYTRLMCGHSLIMSDTPDEIRDHLSPIRLASGHVLINGLGLGVVLQAVACKPEVKGVTVIEKSPDVISLVWPYYRAMFDDRVEVVEADAFEYKPPKGIRYGVVWHDIWGNICGDNLPEMTRLHRKYGRLADWQGSWCRYECRRYAGHYR